MIENKNTTPKRKTIDFVEIFRDFLKYKRLYYIVLPVTFVLAAFITLSLPNYYTCTVKLSPELSTKSVSTGGLASLASSFGVNLGAALGNSSEALFPTLYPDLMTSVDFKTDLFKVKVRPEEADQEYTYYDYKKDIEKAPWWTKILKLFFGLFKSAEATTGSIDPRKLTKEQNEIAKLIEQDIVCDVDKKTMVITISAKDTDPVVCTTMADSAMALLQRYITDYRTSKARVDLEYNKKLLADAKGDYEKASQAYAIYADANLHSFQEKIRQRLAELETEAQLKQSVYQQVMAQYQQAEMKLQEDTPAFAVIQASTIPAQKTGPKRLSLCFLFVVLAFLATTVYALYKEDDLKPLLGL